MSMLVIVAVVLRVPLFILFTDQLCVTSLRMLLQSFSIQ